MFYRKPSNYEESYTKPLKTEYISFEIDNTNMLEENSYDDDIESLRSPSIKEDIRDCTPVNEMSNENEENAENFLKFLSNVSNKIEEKKDIYDLFFSSLAMTTRNFNLSLHEMADFQVNVTAYVINQLKKIKNKT